MANTAYNFNNHVGDDYLWNICLYILTRPQLIEVS